jgi:hypothetical protein
MNYIKHLTGFYDKIADDNRLSSTHVSLYLALFQFWNANRFDNPVSISRGEVMKLSKIGSYRTYYKCMHELDAFGYLKYEPSHNPLKGSQVNMYSFDTTGVQAVHHTCGKSDTSSVQAVHHSYGKSDTSSVQVVHPSLNNIKHINNKTFKTEKKSDQDFKNKIPPGKENVIQFFKTEKSSELEANKFFNYFESNGWKVGGRAKMKNWQAAARNWILNAGNFNKPDPGKLKTDKNYGEPL